MNKGTLKTIKGDATEPVGEGIKIIPHVCNDLGVMGAGVALSIKQKFPEAEKSYKAALKWLSLNAGDLLGYVDFCEEYYDSHKIIIANMIAQHETISTNPKPIRYSALVQCMEKVKEKVLGWKKLGISCSIHAPMFGSGLAQGNWNFILELIEELWLNEGIDVTIYEFD
jgi:O-acetyl-ADP-ribose deacetylase (regulator of RNase III)